MQNTGNQYRLQKISEIQQQLEAEKEKRAQFGGKIQERGQSSRRNRLRSGLFDCWVEYLGYWSFKGTLRRRLSHGFFSLTVKYI